MLSVWDLCKPPLHVQLSTNILIKRQEGQEIQTLMCWVLTGGGCNVQGLIMFASPGLTCILLQMVLTLSDKSACLQGQGAVKPTHPACSLVDSSGEKSVR